MSPDGRPRAVDWWLAGYNLLLIGRWAPLVPFHEAARWLVAAHLVALGVPWLLARAPAPDQRWLCLLYDAYPLAWICAFWRELDVHGQFLSSAPYDRALVWLDQAVFGAHLNQIWLAAFPGRWVSEVIHLFYFSYYPLLIGVSMIVLFATSLEGRRESVLRLGTAYLGCFAFYALWPTVGPDVLQVTFPPSVSGGWVFHLNHLIQGAGDAAGTAFPSSHVAGAVTLTWVLHRLGHRRLAVVGGGLTAGILGATVYTQNHFAVDSIAGLMLAVVLQGLVVPAMLGRADPDTGVAELRPALGTRARAA